MNQARFTTRFWDIVFRVGAFAGALPLFFAKHLPFADLPEHLAVIATLRHWWTPGWHSQEYFVLESALRTQYLLYDLVGAALAFPLGTAERANLLLLVVVAIAFPFSLRALLRALGRDERLGLLGVPLFWNRALAEGLIPFIASMPVAVWGLALVVEHLKTPARRREVGLALVAVVIFYLHLSSFLLFGAGAALLTLLVPTGSAKEKVTSSPRRLLWLAPSLVIAAAFAATSTVTHPKASEGAHATVVRFTPGIELLRELPAWMHDVWTSPGDDVAAYVGWLGVVVAAIAGAANARRAPTFAAGASLFALALASYFLMPSQVGFAFLLDLRMAPFVGLFAVLLVAPSVGRARDVGAALVAASASVTGVHGALQMARMEHAEARHIDHVLRNLPEGKRLLSLVFNPRSEFTHIAPYLHIGGYYRARYGGIASFSFAELPHWPVRYRPEMAPPTKPIVFWDFDPCQYRNTIDGPHYDYVLTRGEEHPFARGLPGPKFRLIGGARDLRLYMRLPAPPAAAQADGPAEDLVGPCARTPSRSRAAAVSGNESALPARPP